MGIFPHLCRWGGLNLQLMEMKSRIRKNARETHLSLSELEMILFTQKRTDFPWRQFSHIEPMLCDQEFETAKREIVIHKKKKMEGAMCWCSLSTCFWVLWCLWEMKNNNMKNVPFSPFFLQLGLLTNKKMQKSNYSVTLITLLIITITLSYYHNSWNFRKCKLQIVPIFGNFTLLTTVSIQKTTFFSHYLSVAQCKSLCLGIFWTCLYSTTPWFEYSFLTSPHSFWSYHEQ